jgi:hypothetical protein
MVSVAAFLFSSDRHFWITAIAGYLFTVPFAISAWSGSLWKRNAADTPSPPSWQDWVGMFFVGLVISAFFVAIDVAVVHPGFSLIFTIGAVAMTFIALPGAVRAWVLELLSNHYGVRQKRDA